VKSILLQKIRDNLVFIEVKTRSNNYYGYPREAVNIRKQKTIGKCALLYLSMKRRYKEANCRFDVIEILQNQEKLIT
jgi:putative endonuclease